ncbi:ABATE domain-containing protein [Streptomyces himalayensis]|uniref:ABATE domain-containing protein n=1 Tax=Streptomyces himalayensis TaxID=2820085 RepID=UPI00215D9F61|nr:ABATE domain-containing protein [Streptomyces himalayensis]
MPPYPGVSGRRLRETVDRAVLAVADGPLPSSGDVTMLNRAAAEAPRPALQIAVTDGRLEPADTTSTPQIPQPHWH